MDVFDIDFHGSRERFFSALCKNREFRHINVSCLPLNGSCLEMLESLPKLQFLGLFNSHILLEEVTRSDVTVAADFTLDHLRTALRHMPTYSVKLAHEVLLSVFNRLGPTNGVEPDSQQTAITVDDGLTEQIVSALGLFGADRKIQVISSAILYYLTSDRVSGQTTSGRLSALQVILELTSAVTQSADSAVHVVKNCCLSLRNFHPEQELARYACEVTR